METPEDYFVEQEAKAETDAEAAKRADLLAQLEKEDLSKLMASSFGRAFMWRVLSFSGAFRQTFTGDWGTTAFREGKRSVGIYLHAAVLTDCPHEYILMQQEAENRRVQVEGGVKGS